MKYVAAVLVLVPLSIGYPEIMAAAALALTGLAVREIARITPTEEP